MKVSIRDKKYFFACMGYIAMLVVCLAGRILFAEVSFGGINEEWSDAIWAVISQICGMAGIPLLLVLFAERPRPVREAFGELGFNKNCRWWVYPVCIALGALLLGVSAGISYLTQIILLLSGGRWVDTSSAMTGSVGFMLLAIVTTGILPGFCEELLHRGILRRGLKKYFGDVSLILMMSLLFALMHTNIVQTLYTFVGGIVMSVLAVKTRAIWPSMIVHFTNNALSVWVDYSETFGWWPGKFFLAVEDFVFDNLMIAALLWFVCIAAVVGILYLILRYGIKEPDPEIVQPADDNEPIYAGEYDPVTGRRAAYEYRYDPMTGLPIARRKPYRPTERLRDGKLWLAIAIFAGALYTIMTLIWRLL